MTALFFVDSNILVYQQDTAAGRKQELASRWLHCLWETRSGRLSTQVLNEFYTVVTRRLSPGLSRSRAQDIVRDLFAWDPVPISPDLIEQAWKIEKQYRFSYWDSLIIAGAQRARCQHLLSEDLQDGQELQGVTVVDPFMHEPAAWGLQLPGQP